MKIGRAIGHWSGWIVAEDDEVAGRFVWNDHGGPWQAVQRRRRRPSSELDGAGTLEPYEGWNFRLVIEDRLEEARTYGQIINVAGASSWRKAGDESGVGGTGARRRCWRTPPDGGPGGANEGEELTSR